MDSGTSDGGDTVTSQEGELTIRLPGEEALRRLGEDEKEYIVRFRNQHRSLLLLANAADVEVEKTELLTMDPNEKQSSDSRCGCCPYGYHIDLDFLRYLSSLSNGELSQANRKKIRLNKKKLRKSMEFFLNQQELVQKTSSLAEAADHSVAASESENQRAVLAHDETKNDEELQSRTEGETQDTEKLLEEFDKTINAQLSLMDHTVPSRGFTKSDLQKTPLSHEEEKEHRFRTETEFMLSHPAKSLHHVLTDYDSCSSLSISSGPSSPNCPLSPGLERSKMRKVAAETKQQPSMTFVSSFQLANNMAALLSECNMATKNEVMTCQLPSIDQHLSKDSADMTQISSDTLQAIRQQMAVSLERMRELEEQVKAIPLLQVRVSILKEEKRRLTEQLNAIPPRIRSDESETNDSQVPTTSPTQKRIPEEFAVVSLSDAKIVAASKLPGPSRGSAPPVPRKPFRSIGVGDGNVFADLTTPEVTACNGTGGAAVGLCERELHTQEHTELRERETKTMFLKGDPSSFPEVLSPANVRTGRNERPKVPPKPSVTRKASVRTNSDFPSSDTPSNFKVYEKELRTVYIEEPLWQTRSTRNVGIQCRAAMRDVGVMHTNENERPMTRTVAVGVGEMGVGDGLSSGTGLQSTTTRTVNASYSSGHLLTAAESKRIHIRDDQLRSVLDGMLRKTVHSVAVQCRFSTVDKGVDAARVGCEAAVDVGCGEDSVDVDVVPRRQMRSVAVDNRPSVFHRASETETLCRVDTATNTVMQRPNADSGTNTDTPDNTSVASNTETTGAVSVSTATEPLLLGACHSEMNTETPRVSSIATSTVLVGDVEKPVPKSQTASESTNTISSSLFVQDVAVNTVVRQSVEKAVGTSQILRLDRSCNTDKSKVMAASTNTENLSCVSRSVGEPSVCELPETEFSDFKVEAVNGNHHGVLLEEVGTELANEDAAHGNYQVPEALNSTASSSFAVPGKELSQSIAPQGIETHEMDSGSGSSSSSSEVIPDLKELHDQTVKITISAQLESSSAVERSDHAVPVGVQSLSSNDAVGLRTAEYLGARPREFSFSFPENKMTTTTTTTTTEESVIPVPQSSPVLSPLEHDRRRMFSGESEAVVLSPNSEMWLSASDDSVNTQCSVVERSALDRSWTWKSDEREAIPVAREAEGIRSTEERFRQKSMGSKTEEVEVTGQMEAGVSDNSGSAKSRTNWDIFLGEQKAARGVSPADEPSNLDLLMDCLEVTAISGVAKDDIGALHVSEANSDRLTGTWGDAEGTWSTATATAAAFRPRYREVTSSIADSFLYEDERRTSGEWPSGTSVFSSEMPDDLMSPKDLTQSSVREDEDVEFPVAVEPRGQGRRIIMTETRTERQCRRTSEPGEEGTGTEGNEGGRGQATVSTQEGPLKSIIKSTSSTVSGRTRKEITFSEGVVNSYVPATENGDSESDGSRSSLSFDEGTYDSQLGQVLYICRDDNDDRDDNGDRDDNDDIDDAFFDQDDFAFSDHNLRDIYELSEEMVAACTAYYSWLEGDEQLSADQLNSNLLVIQREWFSSASQKLADPSQVEDYLTQINEISRKLLEHVVNMTDSNGNTALHYALSHCNMEVVNMILDTGVCDVDKRNGAGYNAIMLASLADVQTERQRDVIRRLFDMGDVNQRALQAGQTALMLAVSHGDANVVRMLLEAGAKVNIQDEDGSTALMCASEHGHIEIVKLLLAQEECDASLVDNDGSTAISIAMEAGYREVGILLYAHLNFKPGSPMTGQRKIKKKTNESSSLTKN